MNKTMKMWGRRTKRTSTLSNGQEVGWLLGNTPMFVIDMQQFDIFHPDGWEWETTLLEDYISNFPHKDKMRVINAIEKCYKQWENKYEF